MLSQLLDICKIVLARHHQNKYQRVIYQSTVDKSNYKALNTHKAEVE